MNVGVCVEYVGEDGGEVLHAGRDGVAVRAHGRGAGRRRVQRELEAQRRVHGTHVSVGLKRAPDIGPRMRMYLCTPCSGI